MSSESSLSTGLLPASYQTPSLHATPAGDRLQSSSRAGPLGRAEHSMRQQEHAHELQPVLIMRMPGRVDAVMLHPSGRSACTYTTQNMQPVCSVACMSVLEWL